MLETMAVPEWMHEIVIAFMILAGVAFPLFVWWIDQR